MGYTVFLSLSFRRGNRRVRSRGHDVPSLAHTPGNVRSIRATPSRSSNPCHCVSANA